MPSLNRDLELSPVRRVRVNECEGQVAIIYQAKNDAGKWETMATITMTEAQTSYLADYLHAAIRVSS